MHEMLDTGKETFENNYIEIIVEGTGTLWLNENYIEEKLGHKDLPAITKKYSQVYKRRRYELVHKPKKQRKRRFLWFFSIKSNNGLLNG